MKIPACFALAALTAAVLPHPTFAAGSDSDCFKPFSPTTKTLQFPAKKGPYRIALANGFVGNTWRIQMIKSLKAYADTPDVKPLIKELRVVSTGTDVAAQIGAIDNFINEGFDAVLFLAVNPSAFKPVIKRAKAAGVVLVAFDNVLDTDEILQVNEDQPEIGRMTGRWLESHMANVGNAKVIEVRGLPGNSVDRDRHNGFREIMEKHPGIKITEVVGNWDDGTTQKAVADAIAVNGHFDGLYTQGGSTGACRALMNANHPFIPVCGEAENGFRKLMAQHAKDGLKGLSVGQSAALSAMSLHVALAALQGQALPQYVSAPIPSTNYEQLKPGVNYFPDLSDDFFAENSFPACDIVIDPVKLMGQSESNQ